MIQIALAILSLLLVLIGIKGFTPSGLQFSKNTALNGRKGKIVGGICIAAGIGLIPLFLLLFMLYSSWLGN
ncbi:MAG: hypothetical protein ACK5PB_13310 [Pirellula sp.]|jgi:hypothetical protein